MLFVPVVLGEKLVEDAFALGWKEFTCDIRHSLVAVMNEESYRRVVTVGSNEWRSSIGGRVYQLRIKVM